MTDPETTCYERFTGIGQTLSNKCSLFFNPHPPGSGLASSSQPMQQTVRQRHRSRTAMAFIHPIRAPDRLPSWNHQALINPHSLGIQSRIRREQRFHPDAVSAGNGSRRVARLHLVGPTARTGAARPARVWQCQAVPRRADAGNRFHPPASDPPGRQIRWTRTARRVRAQPFHFRVQFPILLHQVLDLPLGPSGRRHG